MPNHHEFKRFGQNKQMWHVDIDDVCDIVILLYII